MQSKTTTARPPSAGPVNRVEVQHASGWASHHLRLCVTWASHAPRRCTLDPGDCALGSFLSQGWASRDGRRAREVIDDEGRQKSLTLVDMTMDGDDEDGDHRVG